ncbi:unnamed protein product, partial [Nesidiocoris tenuis]
MISSGFLNPGPLGQRSSGAGTTINVAIINLAHRRITEDLPLFSRSRIPTPPWETLEISRIEFFTP